MSTRRARARTPDRSVAVLAARAALGALQPAAPGLAGRLAAGLFMRPPRRRRRARADELPGAIPFVVEAGGARLRGVRAGRGPAVLLVHGWGGARAQLAHFAPALVAAGCSVVSFDGPGHGASSGRTTSLPALAGALSEVAARFRARAAVAHSLGGAALTLALHRGLALDAAVLVAPPQAPSDWVEAFAAALGLGAESRAALRGHLEARVGVRLADLSIPRLAQGLATPALVVHDRADPEVPWEEGSAIAAAWPGARLLTTTGLGHRRVLRDPRVVAEAAAFVTARLPRCDCGRLASPGPRGAAECEGCRLERYLADAEARAPGAAA